MIEFRYKDKTCINVFKDNKLVGHIFTPSGSGMQNNNCIQVCGFTDLFDYWSCGIFKGFKDVQMHFGDNKFIGKYDSFSCPRCFHKPCQCKDAFVLKREKDVLSERI